MRLHSGVVAGVALLLGWSLGACGEQVEVNVSAALVLDSAPIHSEVAAEMPPGRLAALQVDTILDFHGDMEVRSRTAVALGLTQQP